MVFTSRYHRYHWRESASPTARRPCDTRHAVAPALAHATRRRAGLATRDTPSRRPCDTRHAVAPALRHATRRRAGLATRDTPSRRPCDTRHAVALIGDLCDAVDVLAGDQHELVSGSGAARFPVWPVLLAHVERVGGLF